MQAIYMLVIGYGICIISSIILGNLLKILNSKMAAEIVTRIMHLIFIFCVALPLFYAIFNPLIYKYDELLNFPSLPFTAILRIAGVVMMLIGIGLVILSAITLLYRGEGLPALALTGKLAEKFIYKYTRNPMVLGLYLTLIGIGLLTCSTFFTLWSLIAHFFLS